VPEGVLCSSVDLKTASAPAPVNWAPSWGKGRQRELQRVQGEVYEHVDGGGIELEAEHLAGNNDGARRADETTQVGSARLAKKGGENEEASDLSVPARVAYSPWPHTCMARGTSSRRRVAKGPRPVSGLAPGHSARSRESCGGSMVRERVHGDGLQTSVCQISPRVPRGHADRCVRVR
jgi:hypothetical protein